MLTKSGASDVIISSETRLSLFDSEGRKLSYARHTPTYHLIRTIRSGLERGWLPVLQENGLWASIDPKSRRLIIVLRSKERKGHGIKIKYSFDLDGERRLALAKEKHDAEKGNTPARDGTIVRFPRTIRFPRLKGFPPVKPEKKTKE